MNNTSHIIRTILLIFGVMMAVAPPAGATIDVTTVGNWSQPITSSDLLGAGGSALPVTYESARNQVALTVSGTSGYTESWHIDIQRTDNRWDSRLTLSVKRTGEGLGGGAILGGMSYQQIGNTSTTFFSGTGDRANITLQFQLGGVSVLLPANTYSTEITYTVVDL